jgi:hypothetical protein
MSNHILLSRRSLALFTTLFLVLKSFSATGNAQTTMLETKSEPTEKTALAQTQQIGPAFGKAPTGQGEQSSGAYKKTTSPASSTLPNGWKHIPEPCSHIIASPAFTEKYTITTGGGDWCDGVDGNGSDFVLSQGGPGTGIVRGDNGPSKELIAWWLASGARPHRARHARPSHRRSHPRSKRGFHANCH